MAIIKNPELFRFDAFDPSICGKPVGNNRTVTHAGDPDMRHIEAALHGHKVFAFSRYTPKGWRAYKTLLTLDHCGYPTSTTRQAMCDFLAAAGLRGSVSFAGGKFSVRVFDGENWIEKTKDDSPISIDLPLAAIREAA